MPMNRLVEQVLEHYDSKVRRQKNRATRSTRSGICRQKAEVLCRQMPLPPMTIFMTSTACRNNRGRNLGRPGHHAGRTGSRELQGHPASGALLIEWPTLPETRMVLSANAFANGSPIARRHCRSFAGKHYGAAELAYSNYGKRRRPAGLNMGDCFSYAVAAIGKASICSREMISPGRICGVTRARPLRRAINDGRRHAP